MTYFNTHQSPFRAIITQLKSLTTIFPTLSFRTLQNAVLHRCSARPGLRRVSSPRHGYELSVSETQNLTRHLDSVYADLHNAAACVSNRRSSPIGGTPWSVSYNWQTSYEVLPDATKCACDYYKNRNTGDKQWDQCPDCTFVSRRLLPAVAFGLTQRHRTAWLATLLASTLAVTK